MQNIMHVWFLLHGFCCMHTPTHPSFVTQLRRARSRDKAHAALDNPTNIENNDDNTNQDTMDARRQRLPVKEAYARGGLG